MGGPARTGGPAPAAPSSSSWAARRSPSSRMSSREVVAERRRRPVVVVHGGGKRLTEWLERLGVDKPFEAGRRVTDEATLEVFLGVIGGVINAELDRRPACARRRCRRRAGHRRRHDPRAAGRGARARHLRTGGRRVTARAAPRGTAACPSWPHGPRPDGHICNVNADDAAAAVSAALGGELVLLTDTDGVRGCRRRRIAELTPRGRRLIASGVIAGGMVPKVHSALRALGPGSRAWRAVIADGRQRDALRGALLEGRGTGLRVS